MMQRVLRMVTVPVAVLLVVALLVLPTAATAPPGGGDSASEPEPLFGPAWLVEELVGLLGRLDALGGWLDEPPLRSVSAPGDHAIDPNGLPSPDLADAGTVTADGGPSMDANGG